MSAVVDANVVLSLAIPFPYSQQAMQLMEMWAESSETLSAPLLLEYEITSALRKLIYLGDFSREEAFSTLTNILALRIHSYRPTAEHHQRALEWANFLGQSKAYDAQYLALAESLRAEFWTADRRLVRGAQEAGAQWVHWIGEVNEQEDA
jgi:predicted nucleic acid-binding protein